MKIAVILPVQKSDYLANTVLDGLIDLKDELIDLSFITTKNYPNPFGLEFFEKEKNEFIDYANNADIVILCWGKNSTNFALAEKINKWDKVVFIDGSELGKNNRFDKVITDKVLNGSYDGNGSINKEMLTKCRLYFRREKPYINGIIPFPFGIETRYRKFFKQDTKRDIDFTCIFGQDEYPILRRQARDYLELFCKKNGFKCHVKKTSGFNFDDSSKLAGRDSFYEILARTKVGISIGGGGFDTARFWEILASGAMLMTEKIDIYNESDMRLKYKRITEFDSIDDFKTKLEEIGTTVRNGYINDKEEYKKIIEDHSTKSRVREIISHLHE